MKNLNEIIELKEKINNIEDYIKRMKVLEYPNKGITRLVLFVENRNDFDIMKNSAIDLLTQVLMELKENESKFKIIKEI